MNRRNELLQGLANIITDYRSGELPAPTPDHIERWIQQFDAEAQEPMLEELKHVFKSTYYSRQAVESILTRLATSSKFAGANPASFWRSVGLLNIQGAGASQREMLAIFGKILQSQWGFGIEDCHPVSNQFIYLDDCVFSGVRLRDDIKSWIDGDAPEAAVLHVVTIALHTQGKEYAEKQIRKSARAAKKQLGVKFWRHVLIENKNDDSDVLHLASFPDDLMAREYLRKLADADHPASRRRANSVGPARFFSSPKARSLLEQQFFKVGLRVREACPNLKEYHRPLGYTRLHTPGFGSMFVTFRNCPNSTPLALWVGEPWYPLLERKTNAKTEVMPWE